MRSQAVPVRAEVKPRSDGGRSNHAEEPVRLKQRGTMHDQASRSARRSFARWLPGGLLAAGAGCSTVPPFVERSYFRASVPLLFEPLRAFEARSDGPYPALS